MVIDTFDNYKSRKIVQEYCRKNGIEVIHIGFSDSLTFSIEFGNNYAHPNNTPVRDICTISGASSFVHMVSAIGSSVVQEYLTTGKQREFTGGRLSLREIL